MALFIPLLQNRLSRTAISFALVWLLLNRPFWRYTSTVLSAMAFAALLLPDEMIFFVRHPVLAFTIPIAGGFIGSKMGRSGIGTFAAWLVLAVLAIAIYKSIDSDPVTGPWLRSIVVDSTWVRRAET